MCNPVNKKIVYSLKDGVERKFNSIAEAAKELNCISCNISMVVNGYYAHHHGYKFRFENGKYGADYIHPCTLRHQKRIQQLTRHCNFCNKTKLKKYFHSREFTKCKICVATEKGIKNIGQHEKHKKRIAAGKWKCTDCNKILPLSAFCKNKSNANGFNHNCKKCMQNRHDEFYQKNKEALSDTYINGWLLNNWGIPVRVVTDEMRETVRAMIIAKKETKRMFRFDGRRFYKRELALYLKAKYGVDHHRTEGRLLKGATEKECLMPESEYRSMILIRKSRKVKPIIAINTQTGRERKFKTMMDAYKKIKVGKSHMAECLKSGEPTRIYKTSKTNQTYYLTYGTKQIAERI